MVKITWTIWRDGLNAETLTKTEGNKFRLCSRDFVRNANFLTDRMKEFKKRFYESNLSSEGLKPVKYEMTITTKDKEYRIVRTSSWNTNIPEEVHTRKLEES